MTALGAGPDGAVLAGVGAPSAAAAGADLGDRALAHGEVDAAGSSVDAALLLLVGEGAVLAVDGHEHDMRAGASSGEGLTHGLLVEHRHEAVVVDQEEAGASTAALVVAAVTVLAGAVGLRRDAEVGDGVVEESSEHEISDLALGCGEDLPRDTEVLEGGRDVSV